MEYIVDYYYLSGNDTLLFATRSFMDEREAYQFALDNCQCGQPTITITETIPLVEARKRLMEME